MNFSPNEKRQLLIANGFDEAEVLQLSDDQLRMDPKFADAKFASMIDTAAETSADLAGRFLVKNLGDEASRAALQTISEMNPNMDVIQAGGRIYGRPKGSQQQFLPLDAPEGMELADITDVLADVGGAAAQAGATIAGGLPTGGAMAIPAQMGAAAAIEALRQAAGSAAGVRDGVSPSEILISGGSEAIVPGTGVLLKTARVPSLLARLLSANDRGAMRFMQRGYRESIAPLAGESAEALQQVVEQAINPIRATAASQKAEAGSALAREMGLLQDVMVPTRGYPRAGVPGPLTALQKELRKVRNLPNVPDAMKQDISAIESTLKPYLTEKGQTMSMIPAQTLWETSQSLRDIAKYGTNLSNVSDPQAQAVRRVARDMQKASDKVLEFAHSGYSRAAGTKSMLPKARGAYRQAVQQQRTLDEAFDFANPNKPELSKQVQSLIGIEQNAPLQGTIRDLGAWNENLLKTADDLRNARVMMGGQAGSPIINPTQGMLANAMNAARRYGSYAIEGLGRIGSDAPASKLTGFKRYLPMEERSRAAYLYATSPALARAIYGEEE